MDPFAEGCEAYDAGMSETACPYETDSEEEALWLDGWNAAADDDA